MTFIIIILVIAVLIIISKTLTSKSTQPRQGIKASSDIDSLIQNDKHTSIRRREDGAFVLNGGTSRQVSLIGANAHIAHAIKDKCDLLPSSSYYDIVNDIRDILLENYMQVGEVNAFLNEVRPIIEKRVQLLISEDKEWESLGEKDKKDRTMEYMERSLVSFHTDVSPAMETALSYLAVHSIIQVPFLPEMIHEYGIKNLNTYYKYYGRKNPIISIPNPNYRKPLEDIVKAGLASTGNDMSVEELLSSLTLNKLNEISGAEVSFTRKDKAVKYLAEKDDIYSIIKKNIELRSLFVLKSLPLQFVDFDFAQYGELLKYYEAMGDVVVSVYNGLSPIVNCYKKH